MSSIVKYFNVNEYSSWIISRTSPHNAVIAAEIAGNIDENKLNQSICAISQQEKNISNTISSTICGFIRCNEKVKLKCEPYSSLSGAINEELKLPFSDDDVLVRIKLVKTTDTNYLIICAHHIICDGISIINYLLNIIKHYNTEPLLISENNTLTENLLDIFPERKILTFSKNLTNNITKSYGFKIDSTISTKIIKYSKIINISLNSILSSLLLLSYREAFSINTDINLHIPISLRGKNTKLMFLTSWINLNIKNDEISTYLRLSKYISVNLKQSIASNEPIINLETLSNHITNREDDSLFVDKFLSKSPTLAISNCGRIFPPRSSKKSNIIISDIHVGVNCQSHMGTSDSIISIITSMNNNITIDTCYPHPLVSDESIGNYINAFKKNLHDLKLELSLCSTKSQFFS